MSVPHHIPEIRVHYDHPVDPVERLQVSCAEELHQAFLSVWEPHTLEYRESFYLLLLNRRLDVL